MKFLAFIFLLGSLSSFAKTIEISPELDKCSDDFNMITMIGSPVTKFATTVAGDINVFALAHTSGDPAIWSLLYKVAVTFPVEDEMGTDQVCYVIEKALLKDVSKVKSIAYDAKKGRLLSIPVSIALSDEEGNILRTERTKVLKLRINKAKKTAELE